MKFSYLYAKFADYLRGTAILESEIHESSLIGRGCNIARLVMGRNSYIGHDSQVVNARIGSFCSISDHVFIGGGEHPVHWVSTSPVFQEKKHGPRKLKHLSNFPIDEIKETIIGSDVWIGHGASIKQGVIVGDGAVIGTGAVVTKDVPPYSIVGGIPARVIKYRFDEETIDLLLNSKWWTLPDAELVKCSNMIQHPKEFISYLQS